MSADHYSKIWSSIFDEPWSDDMRIVSVYLLCGRHRRTHGLYRMPLGYGPLDLSNEASQWTAKRFEKAFADLCKAGFCEYDEKVQVVLVVNALKRNKPNDNQIVSISNALGELPSTPLAKRFASLSKEFAPKLFEALRKDYPKICEGLT